MARCFRCNWCVYLASHPIEGRSAGANYLITLHLYIRIVAFSRYGRARMAMLNLKSIAVVAAVLVMSGCAVKAPPYDVSVDNIGALKRSGSTPVKVGSFTANANAKGATSISLRGNGMTSPVG